MMKKKVNPKKEVISFLEQEKQRLDDAIKFLTAREKEMIDKNSSLETTSVEVDKLRAEQNRLETDIKYMSNEIQSLRKVKDKIFLEIQRMKVPSKVKMDKTTAEKEVQAEDDGYSFIPAEEHQAKVDELKRKIIHQEMDLEDLRKDQETHQGKAADIQADLSQAQRKLKTKQDLIEELQDRLREFQTESKRQEYEGKQSELKLQSLKEDLEENLEDL